VNTSFTTSTVIMPPFLPPEILGMIISFIFDIETLLALRLVNKVWHDAVDYFVERTLYVDLLDKNLVHFDCVSQSESLRNHIRTLVWNIPDRPMWNVGAPNLIQYYITKDLTSVPSRASWSQLQTPKTRRHCLHE
jgi:hypothetical protein